MDELKATFTDKLFMALVCPVIGIAGVCGNSLVIYVLGYKTRGKRKRSELLFTSLAITDLISSIILPVMIMQRYLWEIDAPDSFNIVCYVSEALSAMTVTITQCMLILICIERHQGITAPLAPKMRRISIALALLVTFVVAVVIMLPFWIDGHVYCSYSYYLRKTRIVRPLKTDLLFTNSILLVIRDLVALLVLSFYIARMVGALKGSGSEFGGQKYPQRVRKFTKAKNLLLTVIVAFAVCTVPDSTMYMIMYALFHSKYIFTHLEILPGILRATVCFRLLLAISSVVNPIIYTSMHPSFTRYRRKLIQCIKICRIKRICNQVEEQHSSSTNT